ncbi:MAG: hypothetical protein HGA45_04365 [Chloroflexales bacterium]|nr:hypothetical protein [Chloroflexales bacterium]
MYSVLRAGVIGRLGWCIDEIHPEPSDTAPLPSEGCAAVDSLSLLRSLGRVEAAARRMYALLLARLQAGRALLERQPLDLVALARRIVGAGLPTGP